jgi:hypothetical protein
MAFETSVASGSTGLGACAARRSLGAGRAAAIGDDGANDLLVSEVVRANETQVWFRSEHLVAGPLVHAR